MAIWDESKHPRNEKGQFTYSEGGILKGGIEKTENNEGLLGKLLGGYSLGEIKDILFSVISTAAPSIIKTGLTIAKMKNFIKENNLEKELIKKIEDIKTNKETQKTNPEKDKSNFVSLGSNHNNHTNSKIKLNNKIKETPKDILFASSNTNNQLKLKQDDYKSKLLDILGNHATQGDVLYGKPEDLEKKVRELGLEDMLREIKISATDKLLNINRNKYFGKNITNIVAGIDGGNMYNLSAGKNIPNYLVNSVKIHSIHDHKIKKYSDLMLNWKQYMVQKINNQFKSIGYNSENVEGHIFESNSDQVKRIKQNQDFKNAIRDNIDKIHKIARFECEFKKYPFYKLGKNNAYFAFHYVDFLSTGIDNQGNLHLYMFDTYDFNKGENVLIEAARRKMVRGELKPFFTIHEIILSQKELKEILSY